MRRGGAFSARVAAGLLVLLTLSPALPAGAADRIDPGHLPYPKGGTTAIGPGIDVSNENAQLADTVPATIKRSWRASPPGCPGSSGSGATSMSVTKKITVVHDVQYQCGWVSAYKTSSGKPVWRHRYPRSYRAVVVGSTVYVHHHDADDHEVLDALKLSTGRLRWSSAQVGDGSWNDYVPAVGSGLVMTSLRAVDLKTGATRWSIPHDDTTSTEAATVISGGRVYTSSGLGVAAYDAETGDKLWGRLNDGFPSPFTGTRRPAIHDGRVYVSGLDGTVVLDAKTGALVRRLPGSYRPLAFDGHVGFFTMARYEHSDTVTAVDLDDGHAYWSHELGRPNDWQYRLVTTAPVVSNELVWIQEGVDTRTKGRLVALDEVTGKVRSERTQSCAPVLIDYASITVAQHRIFTPSSCGVLTYVKK
ncbi:PQQ-binding-like beta-propeller repeat protein [Microlunatus antarcticus]